MNTEARSFLSKRALRLKASPTLALVAKAKDLQRQGHDVISLSVGEPDWETAECASQKGIEAIQKGHTKYTPPAGIIELREAIAQQTNRDLGSRYKANQISVATGAKFSLFAALQVLLNPGDEVIVPSPYWVSYPDMIELADGKPVVIAGRPENYFKLLAADLQKALNQNTKAILINSPSNPTGEIYEKGELEELIHVLRRWPNVVILSDDIYNHLMFDGSDVAPHLIALAPDLSDRTLLFNGVSKSYAMTGWRIGWSIGPSPIIEAISNYQSQSTGSSSSISQMAALSALENGDTDMQNARKILKERRDFAIHRLRKIPGIKVNEPKGAFYLWLDVSAFTRPGFESRMLSEDLLDRQKIAVVPGIEFGCDGYLRLSFVLNQKRMSEAFDRMEEFFSHLSRRAQ